MYVGHLQIFDKYLQSSDEVLSLFQHNDISRNDTKLWPNTYPSYFSQYIFISCTQFRSMHKACMNHINLYIILIFNLHTHALLILLKHTLQNLIIKKIFLNFYLLTKGDTIRKGNNLLIKGNYEPNNVTIRW